MCSPPGILTPAPVDVEGPLVAAIQATCFSKSQLLFVDLAVPLQVHVEEVPSQYEDEMYQCLMGHTAQPATPSKGSKRSTSEIYLRRPKGIVLLVVAVPLAVSLEQV